MRRGGTDSDSSGEARYGWLFTGLSSTRVSRLCPVVISQSVSFVAVPPRSLHHRLSKASRRLPGMLPGSARPAFPSVHGMVHGRVNTSTEYSLALGLLNFGRHASVRSYHH